MTARASNTNVVQSAAAGSGQAGQDATHIAIWNHATNTGASALLWRGTITTDPDALAQNDRYQFAAGALRLEYTAGTGETAAMEQRAVRGKIRGGIWISYHTGDPGANGTANLIGIARTAVAENAFTVSTI